MGIPERLTVKQKRIFDIIKNKIERDGDSPTLTELRDKISVQSLRTVVQYLEALERKGLITRSRYKRRGISIPERPSISGNFVDLPVFASAGCGSPSIIAEQNFDEYITVAASLLGGRREDVFIIRAVGNSMTEAGIHDGDLVLVERTKSVRSGDVVVAIIDGTAVIKKLSLANSAIILSPVTKDPAYRSIILQNDFEVFGKVIRTLEAVLDDYKVIPLSDIV